MALLAPPSPYKAAADLITGLPTVLADRRVYLGLTLTQQAKQIGVTKATLSNLKPGSNPTMNTIVLCLTWLGGSHV